MKHEQLALFESEAMPPQSMPAGFCYAPDLIEADEEARLVAAFADLPFREFEFHGFLGKRRVVSFGFRYDYNGGGLQETVPIPAFLLALRERAAAFVGLEPDRLRTALVTEYRPGTTIGWHRDRPQYGDVIGVSLLSPCTFRTRRRNGPHGTEPPRASSPAQSISCTAHRVTCGSTASPRWRSCAIPSRSASCERERRFLVPRPEAAAIAALEG
jgi:alkylated DNA repair dioxygenase AlkB